MNKKRLVLFLAVIAIFSVAWLLFNFRSNIFPAKNDRPKTPSLTLPINPTNKFVDSARLNYTFKGKVEEVKTVNNMKELVINIKHPKLPTFTITPQTLINMQTNNVTHPGSVLDLRKNASIRVNAEYNYKSKTWRTTSITVISEKGDSNSSPSDDQNLRDPESTGSVHLR